MPLYTYECEDCGYVKEILVYNDQEIKCINCGSKNFIRRLSKPRIIMGCMRGPDEPSTPVKEDKLNNGPTMRIPEYADRKTGQKLGFGKPEILKAKLDDSV